MYGLPRMQALFLFCHICDGRAVPSSPLRADFGPSQPSNDDQNIKKAIGM